MLRHLTAYIHKLLVILVMLHFWWHNLFNYLSGFWCKLPHLLFKDLEMNLNLALYREELLKETLLTGVLV